MSFKPELSDNEGLNKKWKSGKYNELKKLREKLLKKFGGEEVVPVRETQLDKLLNKGNLIKLDSRIFIRGRSSQCHQNSCLLYQQNDCITHIGTGWALSEDGLWRQHSWAIKNNNILVETTEDREKYYGILFNGEEAELFIKNVKF